MIKVNDLVRVTRDEQRDPTGDIKGLVGEIGIALAFTSYVSDPYDNSTVRMWQALINGEVLYFYEQELEVISAAK